MSDNLSAQVCKMLDVPAAGVVCRRLEGVGGCPGPSCVCTRQESQRGGRVWKGNSSHAISSMQWLRQSDRRLSEHVSSALWPCGFAFVRENEWSPCPKGVCPGNMSSENQMVHMPTATPPAPSSPAPFPLSVETTNYYDARLACSVDTGSRIPKQRISPTYGACACRISHVHWPGVFGPSVLFYGQSRTQTWL